MSQLRDLLLGDEGKKILDQLSKTFDLDQDQTRSAVEELIPALGRGLEKNAANGPGMDDLLDALRTGKHDRYVEEPASLGGEETRRDGNDILGHIFGDKKVSREVARRASTKTGLSDTLLKKMLPVFASVAMGMLGKKVLGSDRSAPADRASSGGLLASLLDGDRDGSIWDDVLGMAARGLLC